VLFDMSVGGPRPADIHVNPGRRKSPGVSFFHPSTARLAMRTYDKLIATIPDRRDIARARPCPGHGPHEHR